jgi:hypothetical protein
MDRDIDHSEREQAPTRGSHRPAERLRERQLPDARTLSRDRVGITGRDYAYRISPAELETMHDIGRFRTVAVPDLAAQRYQGDVNRMNENLRSLADQGLVQRRTLWTGAQRRKLAVVVLTKEGKRVLEREGALRPGQQSYAGFVKPAEVAHDAAIYRMYQAEAARIEERGGQVRRVVLDYELKQKVYAPLAKARALPPLDYARRQAEVAKENALPVIHGKIPLPDLRIEYQERDGQMTRVDLELATHHYHGSHLQTKAAAGFKMYASADSAGSLRAALEEREITAEILSL